jgi:acetoin utilization deacetylase AcuC-like enzyme
MKILVERSNHIDLMDYGIKIPIGTTNMAHSLKLLRSHPELKDTVKEWLEVRSFQPLEKADLLRVHDSNYVNNLFSGSKTLEKELLSTFELIDEDGNLYRYSPEDASRTLSELFIQLLQRGRGTFETALEALEHGAAFYFGGGFHHAHFDHGSGFCLFNDVMIAIRKLQEEQGIKTAWIIDVDAHKGDGTSALSLSDETIASLSIHMADGWPLDEIRPGKDGKDPAHLPSSIDIGIKEGEEAIYNSSLQQGLQKLIELIPKPDIAFVLAGADPFEEDALPSAKLLQMSREQMQERDRLVYSHLEEHKIPAAYVMAGNYGENGWKIYSDFLLWTLTKA